MNETNIKAPIPLRNKKISSLKNEDVQMEPLNKLIARSRTPGIKTPPLKNYIDLRARSATPTTPIYNSLGELELENNITERLTFYDLDYPEDSIQFEKEIYDPNSKWFSRSVKPLFKPEQHLPYETESHLDKAKYMAQVLVNLYIAINSMDIEGLVFITSKDLADLKNEVDNLALKTDMFRLSDNQLLNDKDELYNENDFINAQTADIKVTGKITAKSAAVINVNHWTNELRNCLLFDFPVSLRLKLASVYYYLSLVEGQDISRELFIDVFEILVDDEDEGTDYTQLLKEAGLVLDPSILFNFLVSFFPYPDSNYIQYDISTKGDLRLFKTLIKLARYARPFFDEKNELLLKNTMDLLLSSFAPSTMSMILPIIASFVPLHYNKISKITDYFPFCFGLWSSVSATVAVDSHMYDFVGGVSKDCYLKVLINGPEFLKQYDIEFGPYGVFTEDQMTFMFNRLHGHLRTDTQIYSYSKTVQSLIYSINGPNCDEFFNILTRLIKGIETFVYPSNNGHWTKPIARFIHCFIKMYHARVRFEIEKMKKNEIKSPNLCLNEICHEKILKLFLNLVCTGAQNKDQDVCNFYISCFSYLLDFSPHNNSVILDIVLEEIYDFLGDEFVNSRHRVIAALKQFTRAGRFMVQEELYRVHVTNILSLLILKMDPNDLTLTNQIINSVVSICSFIPFSELVEEDEYLTFDSYTIPFVQQHYMHLKEHADASFQYEPSILNNAFRASTTEFKNIIRVYIDKLFTLVDMELDEILIMKLNQCSMIIIEALDDKLLNYFFEILQKSFWDNDAFKVKDPNYEIITIPLAALVRKNPSSSIQLIDLLFCHIEQQIEKGAGSVKTHSEIHQRDIKLVLYLTALNDVLRHSHEYIVEMGVKVKQFIKYIFTSISNPPLDVLTSILMHSILAGLTTTEITEYSLVTKNSTIPLEQQWGGLQNDDRKYESNNLHFTWHDPNEEEIFFAIDLVETISDYCFEEITKCMEDKPTNSPELIQKFLLILTHSISGVSLLFDPDFNKNKQNPSVISSYREKLMLLKQIRDNNCDNEDFNVDIEKIGLKKDEDVLSLDHETHDDNSADEIVMNEEEGDFLVDETISEVPSAVGTPVPGHYESSSMMNSSLVFRDLDIYSCNYFFGLSAAEKFSYPEYAKIHEIRSKVGHFLHKLYEFLSQNFENNTKSFQILLHSLKVWFADVGQESLFTDDSGAFLDVDFIENIQTLSHERNQFTRMLFAIKANTFHQDRVLLHSTNRYPTKLEIILLKDIIHMATSIYPDIHQNGQAILSHCMKQIIGSYSIIIKQLLDSLEVNIRSKNFKIIDAILKVFYVKKIRKKLINDYKNMKKLIFLLIECSGILEFDIGIRANDIFGELMIHCNIPSSICIMNEKLKTLLLPPDPSITIQVEAVKEVKKRKRIHYFEILQDIEQDILNELKGQTNYNWKTLIIMIRFITKIESNLDIESNQKSIKVISRQGQVNHPHVVHVVVKSVLSIFNKILSLSDYNYDINNSFRNTFDPNFVKLIRTSSSDFKKEMANFDNPLYFIDSKSFVGWLSSGSPFKAIQADYCEISLKTQEIQILKYIGNLIDKKYLHHIASTFIKDNEVRGSFSSSDVSFFVMLLVISTKYEGSIYLEDFFEVVMQYYDKADKASMILSLELVAAMICASKYLPSEVNEKIDTFLRKFIPSSTNSEINQDAFEVWCTLCWWLPSVVDIRRSKTICDYFFDIKNLLNTNFDDVMHQSSRLTMLKCLISTLEYRSFNTDEIVNNLMLDHPYDQVRESVAKLFVTIIQNDSSPSYNTTEEVIDAYKTPNGLGIPLKKISTNLDIKIRQMFEEQLEEHYNIINLTPQEVMKTRYYYLTSTIFHWITEVLKGPTKILSIPYISGYIIPFLIGLFNQKDVCKIAGINPTEIFLNLWHLPLRNGVVDEIINLLCQIKLSEMSYQIRTKLASIEYLLTAQLLTINDEHLIKIFEYVQHQLFNADSMEVRLRASQLLSSLVHSIGFTKKISKILSQYNSNLDSYTWKQREKLSKLDTIKVHGNILGIGAIISAFPYVFPLPTWIPKELSLLSSWARTKGICSIAAKDVISEFKKVRVDTWQFDRTYFTADELEDLEGVLWRSYYA